MSNEKKEFSIKCRVDEAMKLEEDKPSIDDCLYHRCLKHRTMPQYNANDGNGGECGACIVVAIKDDCAKMHSADHLRITALEQELEQARKNSAEFIQGASVMRTELERVAIEHVALKSELTRLRSAQVEIAEAVKKGCQNLADAHEGHYDSTDATLLLQSVSARIEILDTASIIARVTGAKEGTSK